MKEMTCLRCGGEMRFFAKERLQLGKTGWILGDLPNLIAGALEVEMYICSSCKKLEFYAAEMKNVSSSELPQQKCPTCGTVHDFDYPKCPKCGHDYYKA